MLICLNLKLKMSMGKEIFDPWKTSQLDIRINKLQVKYVFDPVI